MLLGLFASSAAFAETKITLQATDIELPAPWRFDKTSGDSPEGAWVAPWYLQTSVSATVSLGQTLAPGTYSVYFKVLDYDRGNTASFTLGDATSVTQVFDDRDVNTIYWSTNVMVTTTIPASELIVDFNRALPLDIEMQNLRWFATYITDSTNETVLRDDRIMAFHYPTEADNDNSPPIKGNHVPNSSFECGLGAFWRVIRSGRTETLRDLWSTNVAWHGTSSIRVPAPNGDGRYAVQSNPLTLASNKVHTISVYARSASGVNWATVALRSFYSAPAGFPESYSASATDVVGTNWTRLSVTTTNLPFYPNGQYYISLETQQIPAGDVYFDGLQVEEGDLSPWQPEYDFEFEVVPSEPTQVYWTSDSSPGLTVRAWNNSAEQRTKRIGYSVYNWKNAVSWSGAVNLAVNSSNVAIANIAIPVTEKGHFRGAFGIINQNSDSELTWLVVSPPATTGLDPDSYFGSHADEEPYMLARAQRLGIKWHRTLSPAPIRWSQVEPVQGAFTFPDLSAFTNYGISIVGNFAYSPAWITNKADITNYYGIALSNCIVHYPYIRVWEIWNEPDQDSEEISSLEYYAEILRIGAQTIKAIDPTLTVVGLGGMLYPAAINTVMSALGSDTNLIDVLAVHAYPPNETYTASLLKSNVLEVWGKPIWNTESGSPDKGGYTFARSPFRTAGHYAITWKGADMFYDTLFGNAEAQSKNFAACLAYGQTKQFYYDTAQRNIEAGDFTSRQLTAVDYDDSYRAKAAVLAGFWSLLDKSIGQGALTLSDSGSTALAHLRGSTPLVLIWATTNKTIVLADSVSTSSFKVYDLMGNGVIPPSLTLNFGRMPQIIEGQDGLSLSNLVYAFENGSISDRADTTPPNLVITSAPKVCQANLESHFRWLAIDDYGTPNESLPNGITYRYRLDSSPWSSWSGDTWVNYNGLSGTHIFRVQARDLAGNVSGTFTVAGPSQPSIESISVSGGELTLTWSAIPGTTYQVQFKDGHDDSNWTDLGAEVVASGPIASKTDSLGPTQRFYRIRVLE